MRLRRFGWPTTNITGLGYPAVMRMSLFALLLLTGCQVPYGDRDEGRRSPPSHNNRLQFCDVKVVGESARKHCQRHAGMQ